MQGSVSHEELEPVLNHLREANVAFAAKYPGEAGERQPVHTVYGGAHIFTADTARKLGELALKSVQEYAPNFYEFARALHLPGAETLPTSAQRQAALLKQLRRNPDAVKRTHPDAWLAHTIYHRVIEKLKKEPVEDFRIDFEDGYGNRPDAEEDEDAERTARAMARGLAEESLPPFIGIRIKPLTEELKARGLRTLDVFLTTLMHETGGKLPPNFVVTIPKVTIPYHVSAAVDVCKILEAKLGLPFGSLRLEVMVETPQAIITHRGESQLPLLIAAGEGRIRGAHFGVYDYTALCEITAAHQTMRHPACDFARHMMKVSLAQTGVMLSDGATNILPVGPHRAGNGTLTKKQIAENKASVHRAWKLAFDDTMHSLRHGFYQGWDLHPAQLPVRYAAVYAFFLEGLDLAALRLKTFIEKAAQATLIGDVFDDAATGQGLLNYFLRGLNCGAITEDEALSTGLSLEELRTRSFVKILAQRRKV